MPETITPERVEELREAMARMTPAPWRGDRYDGTVKYAMLGAGEATVVASDDGNATSGPYGFMQEADERGVMLLRNESSRLLDALEAAWERERALREALGNMLARFDSGLGECEECGAPAGPPTRHHARCGFIRFRSALAPPSTGTPSNPLVSDDRLNEMKATMRERSAPEGAFDCDGSGAFGGIAGHCVTIDGEWWHDPGKCRGAAVNCNGACCSACLGCSACTPTDGPMDDKTRCGRCGGKGCLHGKDTEHDGCRCRNCPICRPACTPTEPPSTEKGRTT